LTRLDGLLRKYHVICSWLLILVAVAIYQGSLACGFVYDDVPLILQNPFLTNLHMWRRIFLGSLFSFGGPSAQLGFYRPLTIFSYWLICRVAGLNPIAYHLVMVALYALSIWIVHRLGRRILQNELAAFAGALLWTVHPLHVEVVAWISSISDVGCTLFCLLGFWMFLRAEDHSPASMPWHVAAAAVYFPALFFKEMAFSFPLILLAYWFCHPSTEPWFRRALHWLPYVAAAALCAVIRVAVMGHFSHISYFGKLPLRMALGAIALLGQHAKLFFWPVDLNEFRDFNLAASLRSPWPWAVLVVLAATCVWRHRNPRLSFLVLWWVVALLPCLNFRQLTVPLVADRFSYLGSVGLCLAFGYLAFGWLPRHYPKVGYAWVAVGALASVTTLWAAETMRIVPHWRDNDALFDYSLRVSPNTAELHAAHGVNLQFRERDYDGAAREFRTALQLNAKFIRPAPGVVYTCDIGLGQVALLQGREPEALEYFNKAARLLPDSDFAYNVLGSVYFPRGEYARAAEYFQQSVRVDPLDISARFYLGTCWLKLGKPAQAVEQFHAAREVDPDYFQAYEAEARALEAAGNKTEAARVRASIPKHE
jgi:Tfp pilus assembly protein PilF